MGDMAGMALDEVIDEMDLSIKYGFGEEDPRVDGATSSYMMSKDPGSLRVVSVDGVVCRCCGKEGLT